MRKSTGQIIGQWAGAGLSVVLAGVGIVALRHALETPQAQKSVLPGEAHLYRWQRRSIFYKVLGDSAAPPLVLLHRPELGASSHEMLPLMMPLARTHRVYALDWLGFGLSDRPRIEYTAELYNNLCQDFLCEVVQAPAAVVACGLSCNYAVVAAATVPACCSSLVLISPFVLQGRLPAPRLNRFAEKAPVKALLYPLLSTHLAFRITRRLHEETRADFPQFYANTRQLGAEHAPMALLTGKLTENVELAFETLQQPILMIWGTHALDRRLTVTRLHKTVTLANPARQIRRVELIQQAALAVHTEQPESVLTAIRRWQEEAARGQPERADEPLLVLQAVERDIPIPTEVLAPTGSAEPASENPPDLSGSATLEKETNEARERVGMTGAETSTLSASEETEDQAGGAGTEMDTQRVSEEERGVAKGAEIGVSAETPELNIVAYCVKCKQKRPILNAHEFVMKNGRPAVRGTCMVCGTRLNRIGGLN